MLQHASELWCAASVKISIVAKILGVRRIRALRQILKHAFTAVPYQPHESYVLADMDAACDRVDDNTAPGKFD